MAIFDELPRYITLSCSPIIIMSILCGTFWDSSVACNFVNLWLHPIIHEIPNEAGIKDRPDRYHEILAFIFAKISPRISALWLAAGMSGFIPIILKLVESGTSPCQRLWRRLSCWLKEVGETPLYILARVSNAWHSLGCPASGAQNFDTPLDPNAFP